MQQHWFYTVWPFIGGGAAIVMVAILLTTDTFRSNTAVSRWRDPVWLAWRPRRSTGCINLRNTACR